MGNVEARSIIGLYHHACCTIKHNQANPLLCDEDFQSGAHVCRMVRQKCDDTHRYILLTWNSLNTTQFRTLSACRYLLCIKWFAAFLVLIHLYCI